MKIRIPEHDTTVAFQFFDTTAQMERDHFTGERHPRVVVPRYGPPTAGVYRIVAGELYRIVPGLPRGACP